MLLGISLSRSHILFPSREAVCREIGIDPINPEQHLAYCCISSDTVSRFTEFLFRKTLGLTTSSLL